MPPVMPTEEFRTLKAPPAKDHTCMPKRRHRHTGCTPTGRNQQPRSSMGTTWCPMDAVLEVMVAPTSWVEAVGAGTYKQPPGGGGGTQTSTAGNPTAHPLPHATLSHSHKLTHKRTRSKHEPNNAAELLMHIVLVIWMDPPPPRAMAPPTYKEGGGRERES